MATQLDIAQGTKQQIIQEQPEYTDQEFVQKADRIVSYKWNGSKTFGHVRWKRRNYLTLRGDTMEVTFDLARFRGAQTTLSWIKGRILLYPRLWS